jgi:hypothetical protein
LKGIVTHLTLFRIVSNTLGLIAKAALPVSKVSPQLLKVPGGVK